MSRQKIAVNATVAAVCAISAAMCAIATKDSPDWLWVLGVCTAVFNIMASALHCCLVLMQLGKEQP